MLSKFHLTFKFHNFLQPWWRNLQPWWRNGMYGDKLSHWIPLKNHAKRQNKCIGSPTWKTFSRKKCPWIYEICPGKKTLFKKSPGNVLEIYFWKSLKTPKMSWKCPWNMRKFSREIFPIFSIKFTGIFPGTFPGICFREKVPENFDEWDSHFDNEWSGKATVLEDVT